MTRGVVAWGPTAAAVGAASIGGAYLAAWLVGAAAQWSAAGVLTMKTNMAASLLSAGVSLWLVQPRTTTPTRRAFGAMVAAIVFVVGALTFCEHVFKVDFRIDQLLASEAPGAVAIPSPNRLGPPGAVALTFLGTALLMLAWKRRGGSFFALGAAVVVLIGAVGYLAGVVSFYQEATTAIAWPTVIGLLLVSAGVHVAEGPDGPLGLVFRDDPGGKLLRLLLPAAMAAPLALQFLMRLGDRAGLYRHSTGVGILLVSLVVVIGGLLWRGASLVSREGGRARDAEQRAISVARLPEENPDPVLRLNRDFNVVYANAAAGSSLAALGIAVGHRAPPVVVELARRSLARGKPVQDEVLAGDRLFSLSAVAVGDDTNVYAHDITARVHAETALRESESRYRLLFQNMLDGFAYCQMLFDEHGRPDDFIYLEVNGTFGRFTGLHDVVGRKVTEILPGIRDAHPELLEMYGRVAKTGQPERLDIEFRPLGKWLSLSVYGPKPDHFVVVFDDITSRKRTEQELRDANRAKDDFIGMLSHELRNPLAPIRNSLYILDHAEPTGQVARRAKEVASRQLTHLSRLVDDLLDVTRIVRGKVELRRADLDITELTRRTADDHRTLMTERGLQFDVVAPNAAIWVNGDETRLAQVVGNLLQNAAKFTPEGGRVTVSVSEFSDTVEIRVRDTGAGVEPELLADIFNPFIQAKQSLARTQGGLGLGLSLAKAFVEMHGGTVSVESAGRDQGATFTVKLPVVSRASASTDAPAHLDSRRTNHLRVLVVEDNKDAAESLADLVRVLGHEAEVAFDGESAVRLVNMNPFDIVLCDIGLPGMSGYQVAEALRRNERFDSVQLIAVSGYALPEDRQRALDAGFVEHIAKPADPAKVLSLLQGGKAGPSA